MVASFQPPDFIEKLDSEINPRLSDSKLSVRIIARLVGMSYSDLYRKLVQAKGMPLTQYIREKRLKWASTLLREQPDWTILRVAIEVGFNSHSYFTRRFQDAFGICPAEWRKKHCPDVNTEEFACATTRKPHIEDTLKTNFFNFSTISPSARSQAPSNPKP